LITVLIADRHGIVAAITEVLAQRSIELRELTQTVVSGYFTITVAVAMAHDQSDALPEALRHALGDTAAVTMIAMDASPSLVDHADRYILTATGEASTRVIHELTALVADRGGNFVEFSFANAEGGVSFVAEIDLPLDQPLEPLQIDLQHLGADAGLRVRLQHQRLFTATNEIAFRRIQA
jgi:predicted amino acid-binding ACT domain protein